MTCIITITKILFWSMLLLLRIVLRIDLNSRCLFWYNYIAISCFVLFCLISVFFSVQKIQVQQTALYQNIISLIWNKKTKDGLNVLPQCRLQSDTSVLFNHLSQRLFWSLFARRRSLCPLICNITEASVDITNRPISNKLCTKHTWVKGN